MISPHSIEAQARVRPADVSAAPDVTVRVQVGLLIPVSALDAADPQSAAAFAADLLRHHELLLGGVPVSVELS